jgi:hypothetical protein
VNKETVALGGIPYAQLLTYGLMKVTIPAFKPPPNKPGGVAMGANQTQKFVPILGLWQWPENLVWKEMQLPSTQQPPPHEEAQPGGRTKDFPDLELLGVNLAGA